jgi:hypothetical protein
MKFKLLNRDEFRESCLKRDDFSCIICGEKAIFNGKDNNPTNLDIHHIIERRLFDSEELFGGYFVENGATLCPKHHIMAEETTLSCEDIRLKLKLDEFPIPEHFYYDVNYDKWGNILLPNGTRYKGDLFYDESVQKILKQGNVLDLFSKYIKYPRTYHLMWSNLLKDDRMLKDHYHFKGRRVIVTLKMDGENTTMYNDYIHARSLNSGAHESRNWVKGLWAQISYMIDENMRLCGENLYAVHSVKYNNLKSYFNLFSLWIDNTCLSWDETVEYAGILGLETVPVIYDGIFDEKAIKEAFKPYEKENEGYVVRLADEFTYGNFRKSVAKYVRPEFRQMLNNSHGHWISKKIEKNELIK